MSTTHVHKLKLFGNAITSCDFNPYTGEKLNWNNIWCACRDALVMDSATSFDLLAELLTTPVCVSADITGVHHTNDTIWVGVNVLNSVHPDQLLSLVESIYIQAAAGSLPSCPPPSEELFSFWTKNVWESCDIARWKTWVRESVRGVKVGAWTPPKTSAARFRSCAVSALAKNSAALINLQVGTDLLEVLHEYSNREEDLCLEEILAVKHLGEICLPQEKQEREELLKKITMQWSKMYEGGSQVDRMLDLVTGSAFGAFQRWKDNLDVHWLKISHNWKDASLDPCAHHNVLDHLLSAYTPQSTSVVNEWITLYVNAHKETQTTLSDFSATHITLSRPHLLPAAFGVFTPKQKTVAQEASACGLFPNVQKQMDALNPNVIRFPRRTHPLGL